MIPITLRMGAFGPYAKEETIDFSAFQDSGLFLIYGPTGAGKSAILDGMTYALYGKSSGGVRGDFSSMRCQYAAEGQPTFLELTFSHRGETYRFSRSLREVRRKGQRDYEEQISAGPLREGVLYPFAANIKKRNAEEYAVSLLGLTYEQFRQVVMLPQGQFERFLLADPLEKEEILTTLFGTGIWNQAAAWLGEQAKEKKRALDAAQQRLEILCAQAGEETPQAAYQKQEEQKERLDILQKDAGKMQRELRRLETELASAREISLCFQKRREARQKQEELRARLGEMEKMRAQLALAQAAQQVQPYLEEARRAREQEKRRGKIWREKADVLEELKKKYNNIKKEREALPLREQQAEERSLAIQAWEKCLQSWQTVKKNRAEYAALMEKEKEAAGALETWEKRHGENAALLRETAEQLAQTKEKLQGEKEIWMEKCQVLRECRELAKKAETAENALMELEKDRSAAQKELAEFAKKNRERQETYDALHAAYFQDAATALAETLHPGDRCPVCGNICQELVCSHSAAGVVWEQVERAKQEWESGRQAENDAKTALAVLGNRREILLEQKDSVNRQILERNAGLPFREEDLKEAERHVAGISAGERQAAELEKELEKRNQKGRELETGISERREAYHKLQMERAQAEGRCRIPESDEIADEEEFTSELERRKKELLEEKQHLEEFRQKATQAEISLSNAEIEERNSRKEWEAAKAECRRRQQKAKEMLDASGFAQAEDAQAVWMEPGKTQEMQEEIREYDAQVLAAAQEAAALEKQLAGQEEPDLAALETQARRVQAEWEETQKRANYLEKECEVGEKQCGQMRAEEKKLEKQRPEAEMLLSFAARLRGDQGISMARFVLGVMLDAVTEEANRLLENVHGGRYKLFRITGNVGRQRKAGLNLQVFDAYSSQNRSVGSLSGGEKFLLALALSLGLSSCIQKQAGGMQIEAMFIDEGFGSLDEGSISDAMLMLSSVKYLRQLIGIISHVRSMQENIPQAIEVCKESEGSHIRLHI